MRGRDWEAERRALVDALRGEGVIRSRRVAEAMLRVPRHEFVWEAERSRAYEDMPLPLGGTGQTISAPHMVAIMDEVLELDVGLKVLEVGAGSGYHAATVAEVAAPLTEPSSRWGHVYTVERLPDLAEFARRNLERTGYAERVTVIVADGSLGYPEKAPYDRVLVTAAAPRLPPPLLEQLVPGGRIVIPIGGEDLFQRLVVVKKTAKGEAEEMEAGAVAFVPLMGEFGWGGPRSLS